MIWFLISGGLVLAFIFYKILQFNRINNEQNTAIKNLYIVKIAETERLDNLEKGMINMKNDLIEIGNV